MLFFLNEKEVPAAEFHSCVNITLCMRKEEYILEKKSDRNACIRFNQNLLIDSFPPGSWLNE